MTKLLIIDDDLELCELLTEYLESEGFTVDSVNDGPTGIQKAQDNYDLIILDVMLPGMDGFEVLKHIQAKITTPILMLTARGDDINRIIGLEIGADDYLPKPCNPRELVARIRAILRRTAKQEAGEDIAKETITMDDIEINLLSREITKSNQIIEFTNTEFNILTYLMQHSGQVITKNKLNQEILGRDIEPFDRSIDMHISNVRSKLGKKKEGQEYIKTVRGVGYIYEANNA